MADQLSTTGNAGGDVDPTASDQDPQIRIPPLDGPYRPEVAEQLERMMPPGMAPIGLFRTFVRNLGMTRAMHGWGRYELSPELSVDLRSREIVIDRTCARCSCEYEWGVHVAYFAERAGLTADQITSLAHGSADDRCWASTADQLLVRLADELHDHSTVSDDLWSELVVWFDTEQLLDLLLLAGWYHALAFAANATGVAPEEWAPRFADVGGRSGGRADEAAAVSSG